MMRKLPLRTDPSNEDSNRVNRKIRILDHPKTLIEVLRSRLAISQGISKNNVTTVTNQYRFTLIFLDGEALCIFD